MGLVSSLHCVGMCGPLVMALPVRHLSGMARTIGLLLYHGGRLFIYVILGGLFGLLGRSIYLAGFQQWLSIALGVSILVWAFLRASGRRSVMGRKLFRPLQALISCWWQSPGRGGYFLLGMANGLLPCGMVYLAVAAAASFTQLGDSMMFMLLFGTGTLPALMLLSLSGRLTGVAARNRWRKLVPFAVVLMGILLILRGLDLGIPFISPVLAHSPGRAVSCH